MPECHATHIKHIGGLQLSNQALMPACLCRAQRTCCALFPPEHLNYSDGTRQSVKSTFKALFPHPATRVVEKKLS